RAYACGRSSPGARALAAKREALLRRLGQLLRGHSHRDTRPHRSARHGPALPSRRGLQHLDGATRAQGESRFRHRAPPVHVDLRAALEGMKRAPASRPQAVLFACGMNSVRSAMAAALLQAKLGNSLYVGSAGVRKGELDAFAAAAMEEIGIDIKAHRPVTFEELDDLEGLNFDLIVTLSPEAHHKALELTRTLAAEVEYWPTADPTAI